MAESWSKFANRYWDDCLAFLADWHNGLPFNLNLFVYYFVKMTNFDPTELSTEGKIIGNEVSKK